MRKPLTNCSLLRAARTVTVLLAMAAMGPAVRADDAAEALVQQVAQRIEAEQPAAADYRIDCAWNKQPGGVWPITVRYTYRAKGWFLQSETAPEREDLIFPTGLFTLLRRYIDPFPDANKMGTVHPRLLPPADVDEVPCRVVEFTNALPFGGINQDIVGPFMAPVREWDAASLRWYIDSEHRIRRIAAEFRWKTWCGEKDVRLTMNAALVHRKPKADAARP